MGERAERTLGESLKELLATVPNVAAATSFAVLILAFVHEWAFYDVLGGQYQSLVSIADYFNSAIGWLPWAFLGFTIVAVWRLTDPTGDVPWEIKNAFYKTNRVRWAIERLPILLVFWMSVAVAAFQFLFGDCARPS